MRAVTDILPHEARSRLVAYKRDVQRALPGMDKMILFGSRARGQACEDSDYDIAVVIRDLSDRRHIRRVLSNLAYDHILSDFLYPADPATVRLCRTARAATHRVGRGHHSRWRGNDVNGWRKKKARCQRAANGCNRTRAVVIERRTNQDH